MLDMATPFSDLMISIFASLTREQLVQPTNKLSCDFSTLTRTPSTELLKG